MSEDSNKPFQHTVCVCTKYAGVPTFDDNRCIVTLSESLVNGIGEFLSIRRRMNEKLAAPVSVCFGNRGEEYPLLTMESFSGTEKYTVFGDIVVFVNPRESYRGIALTGLWTDRIEVKVNYVSDDSKTPRVLNFELCSNIHSCQESSYWKEFVVELN